MEFRTEIKLKQNAWLIDHSNKILTIGSCFAENIGKKFHHYLFNVLDNPFGVLYNPVSIYNAIQIVSGAIEFAEEDLIYVQEEYHSFYHHSDFSHHDKNICLSTINKRTKETAEFLNKCDVAIITYGTSYVYKHIEKNIIVSNCHKIPAKEFERYRLGLFEAREYITSTIELLRGFNPNMKIIFTVSPVRHWKDGATENQLSKANILMAIHDILESEDNLIYFPSYEFMIDDLRDYRFYADDLLHPNQLAIDYIWNKFSSALFNNECIEVMKLTGKLSAAKNHRPRNAASEYHKKFIQNQLIQIETLEKQYPYIDFSEFKKYFTK